MKIYDPIKKKWYFLISKNGKQILKHYLIHLVGFGGVESNIDPVPLRRSSGPIRSSSVQFRSSSGQFRSKIVSIIDYIFLKKASLLKEEIIYFLKALLFLKNNEPDIIDHLNDIHINNRGISDHIQTLFYGLESIINTASQRSLPADESTRLSDIRENILNLFHNLLRSEQFSLENNIEIYNPDQILELFSYVNRNNHELINEIRPTLGVPSIPNRRRPSNIQVPLSRRPSRSTELGGEERVVNRVASNQDHDSIQSYLRAAAERRRLREQRRREATRGASTDNNRSRDNIERPIGREEAAGQRASSAHP